jgi:hypothetical protein
MGAAEVTAFLTALAVRDRVAASTQNQALNALAVPLPRGARERAPMARRSRAGEAAGTPPRRPDARGDRGRRGRTARRSAHHGPPHVRRRSPAAGMLPPACAGCRLRDEPDHHS